MKTSIRFVTLLSLLAAAAASQAVIFSFSGQTTSGATAPVGVFTSSPPPGAAASGVPFSTITSGLVSLTATGGNVVFTNGTDTVTVAFTGPHTDTSGTGLFSLSSIGTITAGTGVFAAYVSPTNQLTVTSNTYTTTGLNFFSVLGNVNAVPEPTSMAALAIGGLGLVARRRRRA